MIYHFINEHEPEFEVQVMCQAFGVSRSGCYAWQRRGQTSKRERTERRLREQIAQIYVESYQTYGSPRIYAELKARGIHCSRDHVAMLMRDRGLAVQPARRRVNTTQARTGQTTSINLLDRDFTADAPNRTW
jgi:transposase InsO family protein